MSRGKKGPRDFSHLLDTTPDVATVQPTPGPQGAEGAGGERLTLDMDSMGDMAAMMGFSGFGKQRLQKQQDLEDQVKRDLIARSKRNTEADEAPAYISVAPTAASAAGAAADDAAAADADDELVDLGEEARDGLGYPVSHEILLTHGDKPVSAMDVDPAGSRVATGGKNFKVRLWDFAGMTRHTKPFREVEPNESQVVRAVKFNTTGGLFLACMGNSQAKVYDREGLEQMQCNKGDMYFVDTSKTSGHVGMLNGGMWHPSNPELFVTYSEDSTIRIWDINKKRASLLCGKTRTRRGKKTAITSATYNSTGKMICTGSRDGSVRVFHTSDKLIRDAKQVYKAHTEGCDVSSVRMARDDRRLLSRSTDGTIKLWDIRAFKEPVSQLGGITNDSLSADCVFSPDDRTILAGTSAEADGKGRLIAIDVETFAIKSQLAVGPGDVLRCHWHSRLNQIFVSTSEGKVHVLYDPEVSIKGALMCVAKRERLKESLEFGDRKGTIYAPHTLKIFQTDQIDRRRTTKRKRDPQQPKQPALPPGGMDALNGDRAGSGAITSLGQYIAQKTSYDRTRDEDPREAILKHAAAAEQDPYWISPAYADTQPVPLYDTSDHPEEEEEKPDKKRKFDPFKKPFS